jgi:hypothetical protein
VAGHTYDLSTQEAEAGGSQVQGQPQLHCLKTLSQDLVSKTQYFGIGFTWEKRMLGGGAQSVHC